MSRLSALHKPCWQNITGPVLPFCLAGSVCLLRLGFGAVSWNHLDSIQPNVASVMCFQRTVGTTTVRTEHLLMLIVGEQGGWVIHSLQSHMDMTSVTMVTVNKKSSEYTGVQYIFIKRLKLSPTWWCLTVGSAAVVGQKFSVSACVEVPLSRTNCCLRCPNASLTHRPLPWLPLMKGPSPWRWFLRCWIG